MSLLSTPSSPIDRMRRRIAAVRPFIAALIAAIVITDVPAKEPASGKSVDFQFFDATLFSDKPDLSVYGIRPLRVVYEQEILGRGSPPDRLPDTEAIRRALSRTGPTTIVCLDIERSFGKNKARISEVEGYYLEIIRRFRVIDSGRQFGLYGIPPVRDYWRALEGPGSDGFRAWRRENSAFTRLGAAVDIVFPSLYTFYRDSDGWRRYAKAQIDMARLYGKPVYVFLWPVYHGSNRHLGGRYIGDAYWRMELETAYRLADGLVIWGGWGEHGRMAWDPDAAWWRVAREFIKITIGKNVSEVR